MPRHKAGYREEQKKYEEQRQAPPRPLQPNIQPTTPANLVTRESTPRGFAAVNNPQGRRTRDNSVKKKLRARRGHCTILGRDYSRHTFETLVDHGRRCSSAVDIRATIAGRIGYSPKKFRRKIYRKLGNEKMKGVGTIKLPLLNLDNNKFELKDAVVWEDEHANFDLRLHASMASAFLKVGDNDSPPPSPRGIFQQSLSVPRAPAPSPVDAAAQPPQPILEEVPRLRDDDSVEPWTAPTNDFMHQYVLVEATDVEIEAADASLANPTLPRSSFAQQPTIASNPVNRLSLPQALDEVENNEEMEETDYEDDDDDDIEVPDQAATFEQPSSQQVVGRYESSLGQPVNANFNYFSQLEATDLGNTSIQPPVLEDLNTFFQGQASNNQVLNPAGANVVNDGFVSIFSETGAPRFGQVTNQVGAGHFQPLDRMAVDPSNGTLSNNYGDMFDVNDLTQSNRPVREPQLPTLGMDSMAFGQTPQFPWQVERQQTFHLPIRWSATRRTAVPQFHEPRTVNINGYQTFVSTPIPAQIPWMGAMQNSTQPQPQPRSRSRPRPRPRPRVQAQAPLTEDALPTGFQQSTLGGLEQMGIFHTLDPSSFYPGSFDPSFFGSN